MEQAPQNVVPTIPPVDEGLVTPSSEGVTKRRIIPFLVLGVIALIILVGVIVVLNYFQLIKLKNLSSALSVLPSISEKELPESNKSIDGESPTPDSGGTPASSKIADLPGNYTLQQVSSDLKHVILKNRFKILVPNCAECSRYEAVNGAKFQPITGDLLLIAKDKDKYVLNYKNKEYGPYEKANLVSGFADGPRYVAGNPFTGFAFDFSGDHIAYSVIKSGKHVVFKDGVEADSHDVTGGDPQVGSLVMSPDGRRLGYSLSSQVGSASQNSYAVIDGIKGVKHSNPINYLSFTADSKHSIYFVKESDGASGSVYVDGKKEGESFYDLDTFNISPTGAFALGLRGDYAYVTKKLDISTGNTSDGLVFNGKTIDTAEDISSLLFSNNGAHFAYIKSSKIVGLSESVVLDNKKIYEAPVTGSGGIKNLKFSVDNNHIYFIHNEKIIQDGKITLIEERDGEIIDYSRSSDKKRILYTYADREAKRTFANVDGKKYMLTGNYTFSGFSPDSKHFVIWMGNYSSSNEASESSSSAMTNFQLLVDGIVRPTIYSGLYFPRPNKEVYAYGSRLIEGSSLINFSQDSSYIEFVAKKDNELWHMVEKL